MESWSWERLSKALEYYARLGFTYKDVPWTVSAQAIASTGIDPLAQSEHDGLCLVGSAEQSFLEIYDSLEEGKKYCALTPCFRLESELNKYTFPYFMKVELFCKTDSIDVVFQFLGASQGFFNKYLRSRVLGTPEGFDLVTNSNIEIGSYGVRSYGDKTWVCGTGLAEPRFSLAVNSQWE